jgi:hypothetical protein
MERNVKIKDYEEKQHYLLVALNMVGINIDYVTVDLISTALEKLFEKGGNMDMIDAQAIKSLHADKWDKYFDSTTNKKTKK